MTATLRPAPGAPRPYHFPATRREKLPNGVMVLVAPVRRIPLVTVTVTVDAGAAMEENSRAGLATLTARGLAEGTRRINGATLALEFEALGTALVTDADWDFAYAQATVTAPRLGPCLALLADVLTGPAFPGRGVERLKGERLAELKQEEVEPRALADEWFGRVLYVPASRYSRPRDGTAKTVGALDAAAAARFHAERFAGEGITVVIAGDVDADAAVALVRERFGAPAGTRAPTTWGGEDTVTGRRVHIVNKGGAPQSELRIGHRGVARSHPDYFPITVMNAILGGLFSSRINLNLRERNAFTYGARSAFNWRRHAGPFSVETAVRTEVTDAAVREVLTEIDRMRAERVTAEEVSLAIDYLIGVFPLRYEATADVTSALALREVHRLGADYFDRYRDRVRAVTTADVQRAAVAHLHPEDLVVLAVGDAATIRAPLERLGAGPVQLHDPAKAEER